MHLCRSVALAAELENALELENCEQILGPVRETFGLDQSFKIQSSFGETGCILEPVESLSPFLASA